MNTSVAWPVDTASAWARVLGMQTKLHRWAAADPGRRFDDVFNLVHHPGRLLMAAWGLECAGQQGGRTAGVDGIVPRAIAAESVTGMLAAVRESVKSGEFAPERVRQKQIPKANGKTRSLGIPTMRDRIVQASLKMVMETDLSRLTLETHLLHGFRPRRRAQDAIKLRFIFYASNTRNYEWVFEADIKACFDEIDHGALMERVRGRTRDKRVLRLVSRISSKAGVLTEDGLSRDTITGHPARRDLVTVARQYCPVRTERAFPPRQRNALGPEP